MSNLSGPWTDANVETLKRLWARGDSCSQIASAIGCGVTRNAVIGKATRMGLAPKRLSEPRARPRRRVQQPGRVASTVAGIQRALRMREAETPAPPPAEAIDIPLAQRKTLMQLNARPCRWPVGDPGEPGFFFCGAEPAIDRPYCPDHCHIAYGPTPNGRGRRVYREYRA